MNFSEKIAMFLGTSFYLGRFPIAPGTVGTLGALPFFYLYWNKGLLAQFSITISVILIGIWASHIISQKFQDKDPSFVTIDEIAGYMITMIGIDPSKYQLNQLLIYFILGFVIFRIVDILKPPPIKSLEKYPMGIGIMLDDVLAGVYSFLILHGLIYIFKF
ncbi:MAG: phosphatidylglycerophosphatase A [Hydrogenothermaceae bacterium]|nr:phosphatidylglycerophosphatase A [Hydrogenothermaceae bacterium]